MWFIGIFLCCISIFIFSNKLWFMFTGKIVEGEIVGHTFGAKSTYGFRGYNYRIRIEYQGEVYMVKSLESVVTSKMNMPQKGIGKSCEVYFNPRSSKRVSIKGYNGLMWIASIPLVMGVFIVCVAGLK